MTHVIRDHYDFLVIPPVLNLVGPSEVYCSIKSSSKSNDREMEEQMAIPAPVKVRILVGG